MEKRMRWSMFRVSANYSVPVIDAAARLERGGTNFADFVHFTDPGAKVFASLVANDLRQLLGAELSPGWSSGSPNPVWVLPASYNDMLIQLPFSVRSGGTTT